MHLETARRGSYPWGMIPEAKAGCRSVRESVAMDGVPTERAGIVPQGWLPQTPCLVKR